MPVQWYVSEVAVCRARNGRSVRYVEAGADSTVVSAAGHTWQLHAAAPAPNEVPPEVVAAAASFLAACLQGSVASLADLGWDVVALAR